MLMTLADPGPITVSSSKLTLKVTPVISCCCGQDNLISLLVVDNTDAMEDTEFITPAENTTNTQFSTSSTGVKIGKIPFIAIEVNLHSV